MDEETKKLIKNVSEEWNEASEVLCKLNPKLKDNTMERVEATKVVVEQVNKFKISTYIGQQRKNNISKPKSAYSEKPMSDTDNATDKQKMWLKKHNVQYRAGITKKEASGLIGSTIKQMGDKKGNESEFF